MNYKQYPGQRAGSGAAARTARTARRGSRGLDPVYAPNSYGGPRADSEHYQPGQLTHRRDLVRTAYTLHPEDDDWRQADRDCREVLDDAARERLVDNIVGHLLNGVSDPVLMRAFEYWHNVDKNLGDKIEQGVRAKQNEKDPKAAEQGNPAHQRAGRGLTCACVPPIPRQPQGPAPPPRRRAFASPLTPSRLAPGPAALPPPRPQPPQPPQPPRPRPASAFRRKLPWIRACGAFGARITPELGSSPIDFAASRRHLAYQSGLRRLSACRDVRAGRPGSWSRMRHAEADDAQRSEGRPSLAPAWRALLRACCSSWREAPRQPRAPYPATKSQTQQTQVQPTQSTAPTSGGPRPRARPRLRARPRPRRTSDATPAAPSGVSAAATDGQVALSWTRSRERRRTPSSPRPARASRRAYASSRSAVRRHGDRADQRHHLLLLGDRGEQRRAEQRVRRR